MAAGRASPSARPAETPFSDERALEELVALGRRQTFPRNGRIFTEGDRTDFVIVVVAGRVKIVASTESGGESVLGIRGAGSLVGELAAFDGEPRTASAIALDPVTVHVVSAQDFRDFVTARPGAAVELIRTLIGRLREGDRRRAEFGSYGATQRVARLLCDLAIQQGADGTGAVRIQLVQRELAGLVGASRESVARALATLRDRQLVVTGRGTVTLLDRDALRALAD